MFQANNHLKSLKNKISHLFQYLLANDKLADVKEFDAKLLHIYNDNVLNMIQNGENGWEAMVPQIVGKLIKKNNLFGFKEL